MTVPQKTPQITADYKPLLFLRTSLFCSVLKSILINPSFINLTDIFSIFTLRLSLFDENLHRWKKKKKNQNNNRGKRKKIKERTPYTRLSTTNKGRFVKTTLLLLKMEMKTMFKIRIGLGKILNLPEWKLSSTLWHHTILYVCVYLVCLILPHQCP